MQDVTLRTMTVLDIQAGLRLTRAAGWNQLGRDWDMLLRQSPDGCFVAEKAGQVVGTVATIHFQARFGWIGMLLVDPAERGRGIGRRLLAKAMEALGAQVTIRLDATPAGEALYRKLDFRKECHVRRMEAVAPSTGQGSTARPTVETDFRAIRLHDLEAFGADRSDLLRWSWEGAPEYARVIDGGAGIEAYVFGRHGFNYEHLGPIVAPSVELARSLVLASLEAVPCRRVIIDARDEPGWLGSLATLGFQEQRPFIRMFRGVRMVPARSSAQWACLGPEFG